jgi:predicted nucleic acid-binding OB-fold protein
MWGRSIDKSLHCAELIGQGMNDELIESRLATIEEKLDKVAELVTQTSLQEYRLAKLEETVQKIIQKKEDTTWKWLTPIISAIVSAVVGFVLVGGLKI